MTDSNHRPKRPSNFNVLTFTEPCPSCGAEVEFASVGSVMSVCEYCQTTLVREGEEIKAQGKQSLVIEDYSPLQLGSSGVYKNTPFVLIGRIQLEYSDGIWNEWYVQFANGKNGWLSEDGGQYTLTRFWGEYPNIPTYNSLRVGHFVQVFGDEYFTVTDKRSATALAGEGELPFVINTGWQTWVIDARSQRQFVTLDYGENGPESSPAVFQGISVSLEQLDMQLLKDDRARNQSVGDAQDGEKTLSKLDCPNCGSPITYVAGMTDCLMCSACHSEIGLSGEKAEVLKHHSSMLSRDTSLALGDKARIYEVDIAGISQFSSTEQETSHGFDAYHDYIVIGIMRLEEVGEFAYWSEYLLYSFTNGFLWLEESPEGWQVSRMLNELPVDSGPQRYIKYKDKKWSQKYDEDYESRVIYAIGAFNWRVNLDDRMTLTDYSHGEQVITREKNHEEMTYTISSPLPVDRVNRWFGKDFAEPLKEYVGFDIGGGERVTPLTVFIFVLIVLYFVIDTASDEGYYSGGRIGYTASGSHK